ncbi:hypothetical protein [Deinococcus roseus]|uniref:GH16 domain-containing protein n=1 Tax=Deinococcus roseus TaxID=392414 RepID=A0ABQ2D096_9DEIO|nr:hypothetical protein [Deinococcus roseus]GGJ27027.1 hypothetical protein GCM10008938_11460 [Deinococcus roseus]
MKNPLLLSCALLFVACSQTPSLNSAAIQKQGDTNTPGAGQAWGGGSFYDDFAFWSYNTDLWQAANNFNGAPFGCTFNSANAAPDATGQNSGKLNLRLNTSGSRCAELKTKERKAAPRSTIGGNFNLDNVSGTLASIFTFKRWDTGGGSWQEIDIEYIPNWPGATTASKARYHVAVIFQASSTSDKYIYEGFIDVGTGIVNSGNYTAALFNWDTNSVQWKYGNNVIFTMNRGTPPAESFNYREGSYTVHVYRNNAYGGALNVNTAHFPSDPTYIFMNYWRGDNSSGIQSFMGAYPSSNPNANARYQGLFYTRW